MDNDEKKIEKRDWLAKTLLLLLPTWVVCCVLLAWTGQYFSYDSLVQFLFQSAALGLGIFLSAFFYRLRFRFLPTLTVLVLLLFIGYKFIDFFSFGEFDFFFFSAQFLVFAILFTTGWIIAWAFLRKKQFPVFISALLFLLSVYFLSRRNTISVKELLVAFVPLVLFVVYIFYAVQLIFNYRKETKGYWAKLIKRLGLFILLSMLLTGATFWLIRDEIKAKVAEFGGGAKEGDGSMLGKDSEGNPKLKDKNQLKGNSKRDNQLLFVAKIDNYFPDGTPNPLYLTSFYYTKFDTLSETFEQDSLRPNDDLFLPDPSKIGLYFTKTDSSKLKDVLLAKDIKTVSIEVYKKSLSAEEFIAPTTAYFIQPIAVEKDNKQQFKSAYRAKSVVSELNSAYFVYNPNGNATLQNFQEMRFEKLRLANDFSGVSKEFLSYYTRMPSPKRFDSIARLAKDLTKDKTNNLDKIVALRDFFTSKDETGKPLFKYSDNPGVPDIPSASKLNYFLFENRKGYCAYYAGATLYMLRSLGIPSRIVGGFLTQDRNAGSNKGWYWFYADQAHAWVQVFFPGYGWIDFDTTIGNEDAQQAPQPDGTPPNSQGDAVLALDGLVVSVDSLKKTAIIEARKMVFKDHPFDKMESTELKLELSQARIMQDTTQLPISQLQRGNHVTAISFANSVKAVEYEDGILPNALINKFPNPVPIDEVHVVLESAVDKQIEDKNKIQEQDQFSLWLVLGAIFALLSLFVLLGLSFFYLLYLKLRIRLSRTFASKTYWEYVYTQFYLYQLGHERENLTVSQFAAQMDSKFQLNYKTFIDYYLKLKYSTTTLSKQEEVFLSSYLRSFKPSLNSRFTSKERMKKFFNPLRTISFLKIS